jgi:hypothetical protein
VLHLPERSEKICLNCNTALHGRYCHVCAQENIEPKQPFGHVLVHFILHFTHFDTKTLRTLKYLLLKPGFLSNEYLKGRRMKYVDPLRLYMTISAILLLCLIALQQKKGVITKQSHPEITAYIDSVRANTKVADDYDENMIQATVKGRKVYIYLWEDKFTHGIAYYDSFQKTLPPEQQPNFVDRWWGRHTVKGYEKYNKDPYNANHRFWDNVYLSLSKLFFISMPLFALFLYLLFVRHRKEYYFINHATFALHFYCIIWFFLIIGVAYKKVFAAIGVGADNMLMQQLVKYGALLSIPGAMLYLFISMLRFYKQGKAKTLAKTIILSMLTLSLLIMEVMVLWMRSYGYF